MARVTISVELAKVTLAKRRIGELEKAVKSIDKGLSFEEDSKKIMESIHQTQKAATEAAWNSVVSRTPVDTGLAVGNWELKHQKSAPGGKEKDRLDPGREETRNRGLEKLAKSKFDDKKSYYITNGADHIEDLDNGKSRQAPGGFSAIAAQAGRAKVK